jgi:hypothetical protein
MAKTSILCQLNHGCMGCCGHNYDSKERVVQAIRFNTKEFDEVNPKCKEEMIQFRDRFDVNNLNNGVCRNLICVGNKFFCPLHPLRNNGEDLRIGHCNINYLCFTTKEFATWPEELKQKFIDFIKQKNLDNLNYSLMMDDNSLLLEFKKLNKDKFSKL